VAAQTEPAVAGQPSGNAPLLEVEGLRVQYGGVVAVDDVAFEVAPGTIVGLIGPNGAGKTTLVDALTGYTRPTRGKVRFDGGDITGHRAHRLARAGLARTFQSVELFDDLTVEENLMVASELPGALTALAQVILPGRAPRQEAVDWALGVTDLVEVARRYPSELSHGRRKLVGVARALATRPSLVLLDEPAAGLDTDETAVLGAQLRRLPEHGVTILLIDHDMGLVLDVCDTVMVLDFGKLIARGTPAQIRANEKVVEAYLGSGGEAAAEAPGGGDGG
jgi:branched-chain amino acid transport system ATP-binding protein